MSCKECTIKCGEKYRSWYAKDDNLDRVPAGHVIPEIEFINKGIISLQKNDKELLWYIIRNYPKLDEICYFDIATDIACKESDKEYKVRCNFQYLIDYLYYSYGDPDGENNMIKEEIFNNRLFKIKMNSKYKKAVVNQRTGQQMLKKQVLSLYKKCCVCGIENEKLLIASHIKPLKDSLLEESYDIENALLLCRLHDGLFDTGLITFDDDGKIIISGKLSINDRKIMKVDENIKINLKGIDIKYLKWHRENVFNKK